MIPPDANAAFVATMEDVLEVYQRPHDPRARSCASTKTSKHLIVDTRASIPAEPDNQRVTTTDPERNGWQANLFMVFAPD